MIGDNSEQERHEELMKILKEIKELIDILVDNSQHTSL
jgi:t-SNARE complex subunit (syntaxin)